MEKHVATASEWLASVETGRTTCELSGRQGHAIERCFKVTKVPVGNRQDILKRVEACFRCLTRGKGHVFFLEIVRLNVLSARISIMHCYVNQNETVSRNVIPIMSLLLVCGLTLSHPCLVLVYHMSVETLRM